MDQVSSMKLKLLKRPHQTQDSTNKTWHASWKCSGIKHCEYAHQDILTPCRAYDRVKLEDINQLRIRASRPTHTLSIELKLRLNTEAWYNAFIEVWNRASTQCKVPDTGEVVCEDELPTVFQRNEVSRF